MAFREKSAWGMGILMIVAGLWYASLALNIPPDAPAIAQLGPLVPYVLAVIAGSIVVQVVLAATAPRDAQRAADERERMAIDRAGNWASHVLAIGAICGAVDFIIRGSGNGLFLWVIGSLIAAQIAEYALQIYFFRRGA